MRRIALIDCDAPLVRFCKSCEVTRPLEGFANNPACKFGKTHTCKVCIRARSAIWSKDNQERRQTDSRERARKGKIYAVSKFGDECGDCKTTFPIACYDFHHTSDDKEGNPSRFFNMSRVKLDKELNKCVMLCANCHRIRHFGTRALVEEVVNDQV